MLGNDEGHDGNFGVAFFRKHDGDEIPRDHDAEKGNCGAHGYALPCKTMYLYIFFFCVDRLKKMGPMP